MVEIGSGAERQPFLYYNFGATIAGNHLNKISKKSPRSLASVDELPLNFFRILFFSF